MSYMTFRDLLGALEDAGLWSGLSDGEMHAVIESLLAGEEATCSGGGAWRADGEDLADGEVEAWLDKMAGPLAECAVDLVVTTISSPFEQGASGYSVAVNAKTITLYRFRSTEPTVPASADPWMDCTVGPAAEVNHLLDAAGSDNRVAVFWPGGNDGFSVLGEKGALLRTREQGLASGSWDCVIS